jgi:hypothetical protein
LLIRCCFVFYYEESPEFLPVSHVQYYEYPVGMWTPFGEQSEVYLKTLADSVGHSSNVDIDPQAIADSYTAYYSLPANISRPFLR